MLQQAVKFWSVGSDPCPKRHCEADHLRENGNGHNYGRKGQIENLRVTESISTWSSNQL